MAELPDQFPVPPSAVEAISAIIDEFIDKLQLIWAANAANRVVLRPGSRLAREIELALIRVIGATVAPEAVFNRIGVELNRFVHQVNRDVNPLFHDILLCCHHLMEGWNNQGIWDNIQPIEESTRDVEDLEERRRFRASGPPTLGDLQIIKRMERTMVVDHQLRICIDAHIQRLEHTIANFQAADDDNNDMRGDDD
ncbi:hypothetical protein SBOR_6845 [Sclerotinia borealis F-4128]|uniref:Uncharacterized protein n=1 Tax=Sclerotinia borealis (strain F-4128) TaxID=1432307 RepID=W9CAH5_SCLBF|nr:hypothetical protein SBOR_6845 [Sclerotinia borealis F-4128]